MCVLVGVGVDVMVVCVYCLSHPEYTVPQALRRGWCTHNHPKGPLFATKWVINEWSFCKGVTATPPLQKVEIKITTTKTRKQTTSCGHFFPFIIEVYEGFLFVFCFLFFFFGFLFFLLCIINLESYKTYFISFWHLNSKILQINDISCLLCVHLTNAAHAHMQRDCWCKFGNVSTRSKPTKGHVFKTQSVVCFMQNYTLFVILPLGALWTTT